MYLSSCTLFIQVNRSLQLAIMRIFKILSYSFDLFSRHHQQPQLSAAADEHLRVKKIIERIENDTKRTRANNKTAIKAHNVTNNYLFYSNFFTL
jgi:hypothetical protein